MIFNMGSGASAAEAVQYDNSTSGLEATNVQGAIDELIENDGACVVLASESQLNKGVSVNKNLPSTSKISDYKYLFLSGSQSSGNTTKLLNLFIPTEIFKSYSGGFGATFNNGSNIANLTVKYINETSIEFVAGQANTGAIYNATLYGVK